MGHGVSGSSLGMVTFPVYEVLEATSLQTGVKDFVHDIFFMSLNLDWWVAETNPGRDSLCRA